MVSTINKDILDVIACKEFEGVLDDGCISEGKEALSIAREFL